MKQFVGDMFLKRLVPGLAFRAPALQIDAQTLENGTQKDDAGMNPVILHFMPFFRKQIDEMKSK